MASDPTYVPVGRGRPILSGLRPLDLECADSASMKLGGKVNPG
jgi:hypothetical protein